MSKLFRICVLILLVSKGFGEENAHGVYYQYSDQNCCYSPKCSWEVAAEWLFMLPAYDQPYFSIHNGSGSGVAPPFFDGERIANQQTWHSAYRLEGVYYLPNRVDHLRLRGTFFNKFSDSRKDDELSAAILNFPIGAPIDAAIFSSIHDQFFFYFVELVFGRSVYCYRPVTLNLEVGLEFARLDFKERLEYDTATMARQVEYQSKLKGLGPEITFDFSYGILDCLSVNGRAASALIISKRDARADQKNFTTGVTTASTKNESYWSTSPIIDFRMGLNYHKTISFRPNRSFTFLVEVGYEVIHFFKSADRIYFVDDANNGSSFDQNMDFTLHGPYVHAGFCF